MREAASASSRPTPTMQPIYVDPDNIEVQGKVVAVIRSSV